MQLGRRALIAGALALTTLAGAVVPATAATTKPRTNVTIVVDDASLEVTPAQIRPGLVKLKVVDGRTVTTGTLEIRAANNPGLRFSAGTTKTSLRTLRTYALFASVDGVPMPGGASLSVEVGSAMRDRDHEGMIRVDVTDQRLRTPRRDSQYPGPVIPFSFDPVPPASQPWTAIETGGYTLQIRNRTRLDQHCVLYEDTVARVVDLSAANRVGSTPVNLTPRAAGWDVYTLSCVDAAGEVRALDFWLAL